jgi:uncharacterized OsmC-like protein
MKTHVKWIEGDQLIGETDIGHTIIMEDSTSKTSAGPSPMEMLSMEMGACTSSGVFSILQNMPQDVVNVIVDMEATRSIQQKFC